uniref:Reverse transcriptase domain-containing protein n=1 Tax=Amphimedon queenslandica TaxID=400682 RepID=A0A1X7UMC4_AMPQE
MSHCWINFLASQIAFNNVDRGHMFSSIRELLPQISPWAESCYQSPSYLHLGNSHILNCSGVQQGDSLGPLGFALALDPLLVKICDQVPSLIVISWYLDDGTLCGSTDLHLYFGKGMSLTRFVPKPTQVCLGRPF